MTEHGKLEKWTKASGFSSRGRWILFLSLMASVLILVSVYLGLSSYRRSSMLSLSLERFDALYGETRYHDSLVHFERMLQNAVRATDHLYVIARAADLTLVLDDPSYYERALVRGWNAYPGHQQLTALMTDNLLARGDVDRAAALAESLSSQEYYGLVAEAFLRSGRSLETLLRRGMLVDVRLPLSPGDMTDPQSMIEAGLLTGDYRYFSNAALLLALEAKIPEAYEIIRGRQDLFRGTRSAVLFMQLAWDAGNFRDMQQAEALLSPEDGLSSRSLALMADLQFASGNPELAMEYHRQAYTLSPDTAALSAYNQLSLLSGHMLSESGASYQSWLLEDSMLVSHSNARSLYISAFLPADRQADGLRYYHSLFPEDPGLIMLSHLMEKSGGFVPDLKALGLFLWDQISLNPGSRDSRDMLFSLLSLSDDRQGLSSLLRQYDHDSDPVLNFYRGYEQFLLDNPQEARRYWELASEGQVAFASFNLARLHLEDDMPESALVYLLKAEQQFLEQSGHRAGIEGSVYNPELAKVWVYQALIYSLMQENSRAEELVVRLDDMDRPPVLLPRVKEIIAQGSSN